MTKSLLISALVMAVSFQAAAQPGEQPLSPERLHLLRLWKLVDELKIDEAQAQKVFPVWSRHQRQRLEVRADQQRVAKELVTLLDGDDVDEGALGERIEEMRQLKRRAHKMESGMNEELTKLLSVEQQARLLLFDQRFRGDLMQIIRGVRGRFRGMRGGMSDRGARRGSPWPE